MALNKFIENYPELEDYLKLFKDSNKFSLRPDGLNANIFINYNKDTFRLTENDLLKLSDLERIKKPEFSYINHSGFIYKDYGEVLISIHHPAYTFFDDAHQWDANPLRFKINDKLFEVGLSSPLFVLLNEPYYICDWQYDFQEFATIKVINTNKKEIREDIIKALYYLNSHYLKSIGFVASISSMEINEYDPLDLRENEVEDIFQKVNRVRIRKRDDLESIEPLTLYNLAQISKGQEKFLFLYRILEFFMNRARIQKIEELRYNKSVDSSELLKTFEFRNEEKLLDNLLREIVNSNQKKKISGYGFNKGLIVENEYNLLTKAIYKIRNSLVHAKEHEIDNTKIPDPFIENFNIQPWIYILDELAMRSIRKYNKTSG